MNGLVGHVVDQNFITHEDMVKASILWDMEEYRLENGPIFGHLHAIHTSHIQFAHSSRSCGVFKKGKTPNNAYVLASVETDGLFTHNGLSVTSDELLVLTEEDNVDYTASSAFTIVIMTIEKDFFESQFKSHFDKPFIYDKEHKRMQVKKNFGTVLREKGRKILTELMPQSKALQDDLVFHDSTEQDILKLIFKSIDFNKERKKILESEIHANEVRKHIEHHYRENLSLRDVYDSIKFSDRTLSASFHALFGFSPKQYLTHYRLGKVHHSLLVNDYNKTSVESIAYDHGFSHMGRFSNAYKTMFGRTPSTTLRESFPTSPSLLLCLLQNSICPPKTS